MESRAKLFGHAIHPVLIVFPLGLLATAVIFDVVSLVSGGAVFSTVAYWLNASGLIGGALAAPFGWYDWYWIPSGTRAKYIGLMHGLTMVVALLLFFLSWWLRSPVAAEPLPTTLAFLGLATALFGGWLGGELVERLGVGVDEGANVNAPSSLSHASPNHPKARV
jgi:uncharacterized membrane protein